MKKQFVGALMAAVALLPMTVTAQDRGDRAQAREARQAERATRIEARQQRGDSVQRNVVQRNGEQRQQMRAPRAEQVEQRQQREQQRQQQQQRIVEQRRDGAVARQRRDDRNDQQRQAARANNQAWMDYDSDYRDRVQDRRDDRRDDRNNWYNQSRFDQRGQNWQGRQNFQGRGFQGDFRTQRGNWNRGWRNDNRYDWNRARAVNRNAFRLPRYYAPNGWNNGYRRFGIGNTLSQVLFQQNYWINDPWSFSLPQAQQPFQWVRYYNDALLVDIYSGQVVDVIEGIFW